jgi:hypothetical protein
LGYQVLLYSRIVLLIKDIQQICMQGLYICVYACFIHLLQILDSVSNAMTTPKNIVWVVSFLDGRQLGEILRSPEPVWPVAHGVLGLAEVGPFTSLEENKEKI